jgi:mono/diheme cytochrome c family protein
MKKTIISRLLKIAKKGTIGLMSFILLLLLAYALIYLRITNRLNKEYRVKAEPLSIHFDSASLASGERLVAIRACKECHGSDLGGNVLIDDFLIGRFVVKNLTRGKGGLPSDFTTDDWVLALKHGLGRDGRPLKLMPSHELSEMSEKDMADIIAYCSLLPDVDREMPSFKIGPLAYVLTEFDKIPLIPAENTEHDKPFAKNMKPEATEEYGKYLAAMCVNCHGSNYKGGKSLVPGGKAPADISSTGNPGKWSHQQFMHALRTGETPEGKNMKPEEMPWTITKNYSDTELTALHLFLVSIK